MFLPSLLEGAEDAVRNRELAVHRMHVAGRGVDKAESFSLLVQLDLRFLFIVNNDDEDVADRMQERAVAEKFHWFADETRGAFRALDAELGLENAGDGVRDAFFVKQPTAGETPLLLVGCDSPLDDERCPPIQICDNDINAQTRRARIDVFMVFRAQPVSFSFFLKVRLLF